MLNMGLCETQWGFQPGKSTVSALLSTTYSWLETLEEGNWCCLFGPAESLCVSSPSMLNGKTTADWIK